MNIQEATRVAMNEGKYIYRQSEKIKGYEINIIPTNTSDCCILIKKDSDRVGKRWNPTANDLIADDWRVSGWYIKLKK